jgi:hypothetical protein
MSITLTPMLLAASMALAATVIAQPVLAPAGVPASNPCALDADDTTRALGIRFKWKPPTQNDQPGLRTATCFGMGEGSNVSLTVEQLSADPKTSKKRFDAYLKLEFSGVTPIPSDTDNARWSEDESLKMVRLAYVRGHVLTKLTAHGVTKDKFNEMRSGLLKLRRLP